MFLAHLESTDATWPKADFERRPRGGKTGATRDDALEALNAMHALPVPFLDRIDVSNAVVYLAGEDGCYVSGTARVTAAGELDPSKAPNQPIPLNTLSTNGSHNAQSRRADPVTSARPVRHPFGTSESLGRTRKRSTSGCHSCSGTRRASSTTCHVVEVYRSGARTRDRRLPLALVGTPTDVNPDTSSLAPIISGTRLFDLF